ncbi:tripartite tricarboxylate transporter TctB family protein [Streptomyces gobiensis]|uniref:tripartite tricarboxylate transporter TctB family protein n=1 Tax=Streptomyces gobiensis TaxID=2875706 RepID=UPI001E3D36E7|nr:tripartite tricarboxylate transporter TctB family protein [Streptomyces gobiensis]UGY94626.1 tripartite tricarboxylate transporter TctB family protein [Streptomyces gobiensis]
MHHFRFSQRTVAAVLGVLALAYTVQAYRIPEFTAVEVPVQPGTLPRGLGLILILLCVALFFQRSPGEATGPTEATDTTGATEPTEAPARPAAATAAGPAGPAGSAGPAGPDTPMSRPALGRLSDARLELAALLIAICLYVGLFVPLGFVLSTALFVTGTAWYLGFGRHWVNVLVGSGVALALYLGMSEGLDVALPTGPLPF